jgi:hypothetical protein
MDPTLDGEIDESPGVVLRGARLRIEATRLLMRHVGPGRPTHYREWYDLFLQGGFILLGKRPEAAFLTAVGRSPIVRRGEEPGTFFIDLALAGELATDLAEVQAELADLESVLARDPNPASHLRQYRVKLLARRRQLDSRVSEAEAALVAQSPLDDKAQGMAS